MTHKIIDNEFKYRMMLRTVEAIHDKCIEKDLGLSSGKGLWMPLLNIICSFIDGLSKIVDKKKPKDRYIEYIQANFEDLDREIYARVFYEKFRTNQIHEFSLPASYGIARESEFDAPYFKEENGGKCLNIDRLYLDFHSHIKNLWEESKK